MNPKLVLKSFVGTNVWLCRRLDALLFDGMSKDGNSDFVSMLKGSIGSGVRIADIGGGKSPLFSTEEVRAKALSVVGVDIDPEELDAAPPGAYVATVCADITSFRGNADADVVIVQSLLEHVRDGRQAAEGIVSFCKPGGTIHTFCPNRRAWFAVLNRWLPEGLKTALLYAVFPETKGKQGFPAYYDQGTPARMSQALRDAGAQIEVVTPYYISTYFMFFFPLYVIWRLATWPLMRLWPLEFCETFAIRASRPAQPPSDGV